VEHVSHNDSMRGATGLSQDGDVAEESNQPRLVQSVERALTLLEEIAASEKPPSATEVAQRAGLNRGTAWRLLTTLEHFQLVERDLLSGRYTVGYGAHRIAAASGAAPLIRRARPILQRLGTELGECVYLEVATGHTLIVLDEVRGRRPVRLDLADIDVPLHCGSAGKLLLAFLPPDELDEFLATPLDPVTPHTVIDPATLRQTLTTARADRYAVAYQEHLPDWAGATAVACDRRGQPMAYLNVTVPTYYYSESELRALVGPLRQAATDLEHRLLPGTPSENTR
jgi:DNA-binding IclR family transcriptional regulator